MNFNATLDDNYSEKSIQTFKDEKKYPELKGSLKERRQMVIYINDMNERIDNMLQRKRTLLKARYLDMLNALEKLQSQTQKYQDKIKILEESIDRDSDILLLKSSIESLNSFVAKIKTSFSLLDSQTKEKVSHCKNFILQIKEKKAIMKKIYHENLLVDLGTKKLIEAAEILNVNIGSEILKETNFALQDSSVRFLNPSQSASILQNSLQATRPTQEDEETITIVNQSLDLLPQFLEKNKLDDTTLIIDQKAHFASNARKLKNRNAKLIKILTKKLCFRTQLKQIFSSSLDFSIKSQITKESKVSKNGLRDSLYFLCLREDLKKEGKLTSMRDLEMKIKGSGGDQTQNMEAKDIIYRQLMKVNEKLKQEQFSLPKLSLSKDRFWSLNVDQLSALLCLDLSACAKIENMLWENDTLRAKIGRKLNTINFFSGD